MAPEPSPPTSSLAVILTAGGSSQRFGRNKLAAELAGRAVMARSVAAFADARLAAMRVTRVLVALPPGGLARDPTIAAIAHAQADGDRVRFAEVGGASRAETVRNALSLLGDDVEWVAVHDAARPLVSHEVIERVCAAALERGAAAPAMPVALTIKQATGPLPAAVERTVPRQNLWAMQTPQVMRRRDLLDAYARCPLPLDQVTDDVQLLELAGLPVTLVAGEEQNLKLTTPLDLRLAELLLGEKAR